MLNEPIVEDAALSWFGAGLCHRTRIAPDVLGAANGEELLCRRGAGGAFARGEGLLKGLMRPELRLADFPDNIQSAP